MACTNCGKNNPPRAGFATGGTNVLPAPAKILTIRSSPFILPGNVTGTQSTYTYMVGSLGPFTLTLSGTDDTPDKVQQAVQQKINDLKLLGAIS